MSNEPRPDMLPDSPPVVETPPAPPSPPPAPRVEVREPVAPVKPPQDYVPHGALERERNKRTETERELADAKARIAELESAAGAHSGDDIYSDEGRALMETVRSLQGRLDSFEKAEQTRNVLTSFPQLADKRAEFEQFAASKPGYSLMDAAQLFIIEKGIVVTDEKPARKGVERPSGGGSRTPPKTGYSAAEIDDLRINHPRKFVQMIREGKINPDEIRSE